jgi:hypothetical protein
MKNAGNLHQIEVILALFEMNSSKITHLYDPPKNAMWSRELSTNEICFCDLSMYVGFS